MTSQAATAIRVFAAAKAEKAKLEEAQKAKAQAAELNGSLDIVCTSKDTYTLREVIGGKIVEMSCRDLDMLSTYLMRVFNDPKGPKKLLVHAEYVSEDRSNAILAAAAKAGCCKRRQRRLDHRVVKSRTETGDQRTGSALRASGQPGRILRG